MWTFSQLAILAQQPDSARSKHATLVAKAAWQQLVLVLVCSVRQPSHCVYSHTSVERQPWKRGGGTRGAIPWVHDHVCECAQQILVLGPWIWYASLLFYAQYVLFMFYSCSVHSWWSCVDGQLLRLLRLTRPWSCPSCLPFRPPLWFSHSIHTRSCACDYLFLFLISPTYLYLLFLFSPSYFFSVLLPLPIIYILSLSLSLFLSLSVGRGLRGEGDSSAEVPAAAQWDSGADSGGGGHPGQAPATAQQPSL